MTEGTFKGKIGVIIITLALVCSVFIGYAINVTTSTTTETQYDYVTDVSGLFNYNQTPTYVDYDIVQNYTGYAEYGAVGQTKTDTYTNYYNSYESQGQDIKTVYAYSSINNGTYSTQNVQSYTIKTTEHTYTIGQQIFTDGTLLGTISLDPYGTFTVNNGTITAQYYAMDILELSTYYYEHGEYPTQQSFTLTLPSYYIVIPYSVDNSNPTGTPLYSWDYARLYDDDDNQFYFTSSTNAFFFNATTMQLIAPSTLIANATQYHIVDMGHGVYRTDMDIDSGTIYGITSTIYSNAETITSSTYTVYDMNNLNPTGNKGISYTTTSQPNAYVVGSTSNSGTGNKALSTNNYSELTIPSYTYRYVRSTETHDNSGTWTNYNFKLYQNAVTVLNYVASLNLPASTTEITLSWNNGFIGNDYNSIQFASKNSVGVSPYEEREYFKHLMTGYLIPTDYRNPSIKYNVTDNRITYLSWVGNVNLSGSDYAFFYNKNPYTYNANNQPTYLDHVEIYDTETGSYFTNGYSHSVGLETSIINYAYSYTTPTYMDVNRGITINTYNSHTVARWNNGYENGTTQIVFHAENNGTTYTNSMKLSTGDTITITRGTDLHTRITLNNATTPVDIGVWSSYILTINAQSGVISATPVDIFYNYTTVALYPYVYHIGNIAGGQSVRYIDWGYTTQSFGISIYKTQVFLNTYGAVMKDPSLTITNYFVNENGLRLNLYSFALYGDTMTINGHTFYGNSTTSSIRDTGAVHYDSKTYTLQNIIISYNDGHTYLTFIDDNKTIDLGTTTSYNISFGGYWYFTTALYEGKIVTVNNYTWDTTKFAIDMQGLAIMCLGLTIVGTIIARRFMREQMTALDYVLIIGAIAVFGALLGGIML